MNFQYNLGNRRCCNVSIDGPQGARGPEGDYGPIGERGNPGARGPTGPQGEKAICHWCCCCNTAEISNECLVGDTGPQGYKGVAGSLGKANKINYEFTVKPNTIITDSFEVLTGSDTFPTVSLSAGNYVIYFEINESWSDFGGQLYIQLQNISSGTYYYPYVYNPSNSSSLVLKSNGQQTFGIDNDVIFGLDNGNYSILIFQQTVSGSFINVSGQKVKFSVTFVKIS